MSEVKTRKVHTPEFKAKVGLDALRGLKTIHEIDFGTSPYSNSNLSFVPFTRPGCAVICRNRDIAHGRTAFIDGPRPHQRRVLSRKWFMTTEDATVYRHVPGLAMRNDIAKIAPELFGSQQLKGQWLYDQTHDKNVRVN